MISTRYLHTIGGIFALALIPTVMHTYVGMSHEDGRTTGAIAHQLAGFEGVATSRSPAWVKNVYESDDFIERRYGGDVTLFVARSYDLKALYHHPELAIAHGLSYDSASIAPATCCCTTGNSLRIRFGSMPARRSRCCSPPARR